MSAPNDILQQLNAELEGVVDHVWQSLVQISSGGMGAGAGTIWHTDGLIITNAHVVGHHSKVQVTLPNGKVMDGEVVARAKEDDIAAVVITANNLKTIQPGDSKALRPGAWVYAIGHPWGVKGAVTGGVVIGMGAELPDMGHTGRDWLAVDCHMRPGHSGGPLVDVYGRLVGINTMITGPNVGFAVPSHVVKAFLKQTFTPESFTPIPQPQSA